MIAEHSGRVGVYGGPVCDCMLAIVGKPGITAHSQDVVVAADEALQDVRFAYSPQAVQSEGQVLVEQQVVIH